MGLNNLGTTSATAEQIGTAQGSVIVVDGVQITSNNNFFGNINGLNITINASMVLPQTYVPGPDDGSGNPTPGSYVTTPLEFNVVTAVNTDATVARIREFVNAYNELIRNLNALHSTPRPRGQNRQFFEPLTNEQREAMSDREIERWEDQARVGMLHRDETIRNIHQQLRTWMQTPVQLRDEFGNFTGARMHLSNVGITTSYGQMGDAGRMMGLLHIDEDVLIRELERDPTAVQQLFMSASTTPIPPSDHRARSARLPEQGLMARINDIVDLSTWVDGSLRVRAGLETGTDANSNTLSVQIRRYDDQMAQMQRWLQRRETHFFAMFSRMEQAMAQSQAQMDSLWSMVGM
jgi:flagellar hook-associated protein 2